MKRPGLAELERIAREEIAQALGDLPPEVRAPAREVPVLCEASPGPEAPFADCLGLFAGDPIGTADAERDLLPPRILLYLDNLWEESEGDLGIFREEARITFFHELGHYFGWDEEELEQRGLA